MRHFVLKEITIDQRLSYLINTIYLVKIWMNTTASRKIEDLIDKLLTAFATQTGVVMKRKGAFGAILRKITRATTLTALINR
ncbi:hypothetical protein D3C87_1673510 [compost metagenome]